MVRRLLALFVSLALLVPAGTLGGVPYVCRISGETGSSCCCSARHQLKQAKDEKRPSAIKRPGCCETTFTAAVERPTSMPGADFQVLPGAFVTRLPVELSVAAAPPQSLSIRLRARGPPPLGDPLYLENYALLS